MKNKILFFLLLLWFWFPASHVQAMEVITLKATPEDLSASISPVYDLNGKACALMKIVLPIDNAIFEGNVMGNVGYVNNEYWVYLTEGTRFLKIKTPRSGSLTIDFSSYGIHGLVSKQTYELSISVKDEIQEFQSLTIRYQPANAQLYLNGTLMKGVNGMWSQMLPVGTYEYLLKAGLVKNKGILHLSAAVPTEISLDLSSKKDEKVQESLDGQYAQAMKLVKEYHDSEAEKLAMLGIGKGEKSCYDVLEILLLKGYYDSEPQKKREIAYKISENNKLNVNE